MWERLKGESKEEKELRAVLKQAEKLYNAAIAHAPERKRMGEEDKSKQLYYSQKPFPEQVDEVLGKTSDIYYRYNDVLVRRDTPQILQDVGLLPLPMLMSPGHIKAINKSKNNKKHHHGISTNIIKKIPKMLESPVMVMDSLSRNDSIVVIGEEIIDNNPILIAIKVSGDGKVNNIDVETNYITSAYGRNNFNNYLKENIANNKILYANKKRSQELFSLLGVQFPSGFNNLNFDTIIRKTSAVVNPSDENNSEKFSVKSKGIEKSLTKDGDIAYSTIDDSDKQSDYTLTIAPYYSTNINNENFTETQKKAHEIFFSNATQFSKALNIDLELPNDCVGGYSFEAEGNVESVVELSYAYMAKNITQEQAELFTCLMSDLGQEVQDTGIVSTYCTEEEAKNNPDSTALQIEIPIKPLGNDV